MSEAENTPAAFVVRGANVRIPPGFRRNPIVFVDLAMGPHWAVTVACQNLLNSGHIMRLPTGLDGGPAIRTSPEMLAQMQRAAAEAIRADPIAFAHLTGPHPGKRKPVGKRPKPEAAA
ncbi:hypothetical protein [Sediminicoccus sp. BL-A-41-H5]|uniref:hypothetical protein n=1 Tax=Sediminicoccus sp. BL-A-41-H5 TaxID=3421106 RepID=UPI003D67BC79